MERNMVEGSWVEQHAQWPEDLLGPGRVVWIFGVGLVAEG